MRESFTDASYRINANGLIGQKGDLLGHNLFAYRKNNSINMSEPSGFISIFLLGALSFFIVLQILIRVAPYFAKKKK